MARYSIFIERENGKDRVALKLKHNGILENKFDLEVIDRYLTQFKDQDDFLTKMAKMDALPYIPKKCFIGYIYNDEIKEKNIIYNNAIIKHAAEDIINKKRLGVKNKQLILDPTIEVKDFIHQIKGLAVNDDSAFKSMFFSGFFPKHVYDLLNEYRKLKKSKLTSESLKQIEEIAEKIDYNIRNYKFYRAIYLWYKKYQKKQEIKANEKKDYNQLELSQFMDISSKLINSPKQYVIEDQEVENDNIDSKITIEDVLEIYQQDGIEGVMNYYDIDDLKRILNDEEMKKMGLYFKR
jgi:hypothetical protein